MKKILSSPLWKFVALTGLGLCLGILTLVLSACAYPTLSSGDLLRSYVLENKLIVPVNACVPILLVWLGYFLTRRGWAAYLMGSLLPLTVGLVNYYKISLRSDPLLATDLLLVAEAKGILDNYQLDLTPVILAVAVCFVLGLLAAFLLIPKSALKGAERWFGATSTVAILLVCMVSVFLNSTFAGRMTNNKYINQWSDTEVFVSKGVLYSFLNSARDMFPQKPAGYDPDTARQVLSAWQDVDIPQDRQVSVMAIMLEAFCDLTDYPALAQQEGVAQVYAPWHELESQSIHGDLLTNIFAGGTVDSEWGFLTGYTSHDDFRTDTDSYVWYLRNQGYQTFGSHPGHGWFYNRQNVNQYLGFEEYWFTENHYGALVDPTAAIWNSDHILMPELLGQMRERVKNGPCFSFSVSYQNHGPYEAASSNGEHYVTNLDEESNNIFNNYLHGIKKTIAAVEELVAGLEEMEQPVVLVLFGDHKPWAGNANSAYLAAGVDFDLSKTEGFYNYYSTPYVIWANSAAREQLGNQFTGHGGDFSPCFLMTEVFDQCGWEGPGFMQLSREIRDITPLVHTRSLYWKDNALTDTLPQLEQEKLSAFLAAQYHREHGIK